MHFIFGLAISFVIGHYVYAGCLDYVSLTGTIENEHLEGNYTLTGIGCDYNHSVYMLVGSYESYMYHVMIDKNAVWCVAALSCSDDTTNHVILAVTDDAKSPADVTATWTEKQHGGGFLDSPDVNVECEPESESSSAAKPFASGVYTVTVVSLLMMIQR